MPAFTHFEKELNFRTLPARIKALTHLGVPYSSDVLQDPEAVALDQARKIVAELLEQAGPEQQAWELTEGVVTTTYKNKKVPLERTQMIAVIAYLQRLGVDLTSDDTADDSADNSASETPDTSVEAPSTEEPPAGDDPPPADPQPLTTDH